MLKASHIVSSRRKPNVFAEESMRNRNGVCPEDFQPIGARLDENHSAAAKTS